MHVEQWGSTLFITNPNGWTMADGELTISLREAKALRDAIDRKNVIKETEGVEDNGEDG